MPSTQTNFKKQIEKNELVAGPAVVGLVLDGANGGRVLAVVADPEAFSSAKDEVTACLLKRIFLRILIFTRRASRTSHLAPALRQLLNGGFSQKNE